MDSATIWVLAGSAVFLVGASFGVPRVFTEPDPAERYRMLEADLLRWRASQPFYALGPLIAAVGVGVLATATPSGAGGGWLALACLLLLVGAGCWSWTVSQRFRHVRAFAFGELAGWPFVAYVYLTLAGLAALGTGLLVSSYPAWTGWLALAGAVAFLIGYVRFRDLPPFVFYLLLPIVSLGWR